MKSLTFAEFNTYVHWAGQLLSQAQLQSVWTNDHCLVMEFYKFHTLWLVVDLNPRSPQVILVQNATPPIRKKSKPVGLFLNSHAKNLRVELFESDPKFGRVAILQLSSPGRSCVVEMQLAPHHVNILVASEGKKISWQKPRDLPLVPTPTSEILSGREEEWVSREPEWLESLRSPGAATESSRGIDQVLAKKQKALAAMEASLREGDELKWKTLGDLLKSHQEIPDDLKVLIEAKLDRSQNIERAFQKAKDVIRKRHGTEERIQRLKEEIERIRAGTYSEGVKAKSAASRGLEKGEARGRKLHLGKGLDAICGKSAKDNLAILRQARAWDLWLHLKDYPGAHAIIFRERNAPVDISMIEKTAQWLIQESPAARGAQTGAKYEVVVAETRYVRPLKGDTLGRVTYHHPTVYSFASKQKK